MGNYQDAYNESKYVIDSEAAFGYDLVTDFADLCFIDCGRSIKRSQWPTAEAADILTRFWPEQEIGIAR